MFLLQIYKEKIKFFFYFKHVYLLMHAYILITETTIALLIYLCFQCLDIFFSSFYTENKNVTIIFISKN